MAHKTLINGTAYEIGGGKTLVGGTAYSIDKGKTLVGGTAYEIGFIKTLGELSVGETVSFTVNGVSKDFIVVHQGLPSSSYDSSCDGTWLLMKNIYTTLPWNCSKNSYVDSQLHSYLNDTFFSLLDSNVKDSIKQVKIPYTNGNGKTGSLSVGSSGLSTKCFLLSYSEVTTSSRSDVNAEGSILNYFSNNKYATRIAYLDGVATYWWLRSPNTGYDDYAWTVKDNGQPAYQSIQMYEPSFDNRGIRPTFIMPSDFIIS